MTQVLPHCQGCRGGGRGWGRGAGAVQPGEGPRGEAQPRHQEVGDRPQAQEHRPQLLQVGARATQMSPHRKFQHPITRCFQGTSSAAVPGPADHKTRRLRWPQRLLASRMLAGPGNCAVYLLLVKIWPLYDQKWGWQFLSHPGSCGYCYK